MHVESRQDKGGQGESRETKRSRVGQLAVLIGLPVSDLQSTAEGLGVLALDKSAVVGVLPARVRLLVGGAIGSNVLLSSAGNGGVVSRHDAYLLSRQY